MSDKNADRPNFPQLVPEVPEAFSLLAGALRAITPPEYMRQWGYSEDDFARKQSEAEHFVEVWRGEHERTGNPLLAWRAYIECRAFDIPLPEWVLRYLDAAALDLLDIPEQQPKEPASAVMEALRFKRPGRSGRGNAFSNYMDLDALMLALDVRWHVKGGDKPDFAYDAVARKRGVGRSTVQRAWMEFRRLTEATSE